MKRRVRMIIQYDGTNYEGWQRQLTGMGIQQIMEEELFKLILEIYYSKAE